MAEQPTIMSDQPNTVELNENELDATQDGSMLGAEDHNELVMEKKTIVVEAIGDQIVVVSETLVCTVNSELDANLVAEEKPTMDEKRRSQSVKYYAKRLNEVRDWIADCLGNELVPKATDLEEDFRSGILLARLANFFAPNLVSLDKIFDLDGERRRTKGLEYRHTDNIVKWRTACQSILAAESKKISSVILPEPSDVYAGRNVRTIFALLALAKRLHRLGKAPMLRDHTEVHLTDEDYRIFTERVEIAELEEGIDWHQMEMERYTVESTFIELDNQSAVADDIVEVAGDIVEVVDNTLPALRYLCRTMNLSHKLYEADFSLEEQKTRLNKLLESNDALKVDLQELEGNIGLLVKNFRSIKDHSDKKAEQERKQEIEKACQMQASSTQNLSDDSVYNDEENSASSYDGEEPRSLARVSCQTMESRSHDERVQPDYMLAAKAHVLTLLAAGVQGETVKELGVSQNYIAVDEETRSKIEEAQKMLGYTLKKLVELRQISSDEGQEVLTAIFYDVRNDSEHSQGLKERKEHYDRMLENASKSAQQMMAQIEAYRKYENVCLKNMTGGAPSINIAEELNKKVVQKFLRRKQKAISKNPVKLSSEKMIKKKILFMDDTTTPKKVSKYSMIITSLDEPGHYKFESILDGHIKHTQTIVFEDLLRREALGQFRLPFDEPLVFDCLGLRRYIDNKFHSKSFI